MEKKPIKKSNRFYFFISFQKKVQMKRIFFSKEKVTRFSPTGLFTRMFIPISRVSFFGVKVFFQF